MSRFVIMAEEAIKKHKDENIDDFLNKIASENELNVNEHQRLIEEYNIGSFLSKLQEGTQHEEYQVASPVQTAANISSGDNQSLGKVASDNTKYVISDDMFHVEIDNVTNYGELEKVASSSIGDEIFTSEEKWDDAISAIEKIKEDDSIALEKIAKSDLVNSLSNDLLKVSSFSEGMTKTAILSMHKAGFTDNAESMLENSKFSTSDISESVAEPLSVDGMDILSKIVNIDG